MHLRTHRTISFAAVVCAAAAFACTAATGDAAKESSKAAKTTAKPAAALSANSPVAVIGDKTITLSDLDGKAAAALVRVRQDEYEARKQVLDTLVNDEVLSKEAAAKKVSKEDLIKTEVTDKAPDPPQAEIDAFYEQNKARFASQPMADPPQTEIDAYYEKNKSQFGTQSKEQAKPQVVAAIKSQKLKDQMQPQIAAMLKNAKMGDAQRTYMKTLRQKYGVKTLLEPPRMDVDLDDDAAKGPAKAPITIVEFSDYQCPYCSRAEQTVNDVLKKYGDKVRLVYRDYPLQFHQNANIAAQASECAKEQGKFWEMHQAMFANQAKLAQNDLVETAGGIAGVDKDKFKTCLDSSKYSAEVQKDFEDGQKYGVTGTPTFFINGIPMVGARDVAAFSDIIDSELERKQ